MTARTGDILRRPPRRGARQWRYISPHRRGAGVALLMLLTLGVAAYWLVPRLVNSWTRERAIAYLRTFTGGQVTIREARFNLFGGIELRGVEVDLPSGSTSKPLLQANTIVLRHRPWSLLSEGRLEPTEIVCIAPVVTLEYDAQRHRYTAEDLITSAHMATSAPAKPGSAPAIRPTISIRDVRLRLLTGQALLNISMVPIAGGYRITLEEEQPAAKDPLYGTWRLDLATGRLVLEESKIPRLAHTDALLPAQYAAFRKRYDIRGRVVLKGGSAVGPKAVLEARLDDVSIQLQPAEGGLGLTNVNGTLVFEESRVRVTKLTGQVPQAGEAGFTARGVYEGYDPNSPFDLHVSVEGMVLPDGSRAAGWLADALKLLRESFRPGGKVDVQADVRRKARGPIELTGTARPIGMSFLYEEFPYVVDQVQGTVAFQAGPDGDRVLLRDITARHGPAEMTVAGEVDLRKSDCFDVRVTGKNVPLDAALRAAIPKEFQPHWDRFRPGGQAGANVHVWQEGRGQPQHTTVQVLLDGRAAMTYEGFPYRLEGLSGMVRIDGGEITVETLTGRNGPMRCTIDGSLSGLATAKGQTNLTIEAAALPLDANLLAALPAKARDLVTGLRLTGRAERAGAWLRQSAKDPLDFTITATVKDVALRPEAFPYAIAGVSGTVIVHPGWVDLVDLAGAHGKSKLELRGQVVLDGHRIGLDIQQAKGTAIALDADLLAALPEDARKIWRQLSPAGQADVGLRLQHNLPGAARKVDYALTVQARGMTVRYEDFPYALSDVVGRAVVTPDGVSLEGITAKHGDARLAFHGRLSQGPGGAEVHLALDGNDVPVDRDLLVALPASLAPLAGRFQPGGRCNLLIESLDVFRPAPRGPAASRPATAPATGPAAVPATAAAVPATAPADPAARWSIRGAVAVRDVTVDLGLGHETLTGGLRGEAVQKGTDLSVNALVALDSVILGAKQLTQLRGQVTKKPASDLLRLQDLTAQAYGGQVAGFAEIRLADPLEFGVSLAVQDIHLEELFKGDPNAADAHKVRGLLAGNIQLTSAGGKKPIRQASGVLKISDAELYKLPVMLGLLNVIYLAVPGDAAFTQGRVTYRLRNDKMIFDEIWLQGAALSVVGSGNMDMKAEVLDLTFLTGPPNKLRGLAGLSDLVDNVVREVAQIQVEGTLSKPRMRTVPLRSLDRLIREMLNPGRTK